MVLNHVQFPSGPQVDTSPPAAPEIHVYAVVDERNVRRNRYHPHNLRLRTVDDNTRRSCRRRENTRFFDVDAAKLINQMVYDVSSSPRKGDFGAPKLGGSVIAKIGQGVAAQT